ncbi:maleylacetoacetate isomerase [Temperatibacter marinus]|uniref:Maleylacetoacetate isomerase n=1 Tax=Temperatibacter marinus TaxID=1456591 RepID=A0AA52EC25_9PROT|nr:maleylacetoacetate isomerase [Temperatibacter marinus]WND02041.1 maleylacetoacetate isomerase [Temperatibacter marinus]
MRTLYGYFRSSAAFRVRISLALKGIDYVQKSVNLHPEVAANKTDEFLALNPQGRVPYFIDGDLKISQSPAILDYLEEAYTDIPLMPADLDDRTKIRQLCNLIACDVHPLNNLSVLQYLKKNLEQGDAAVNAWYQHWIVEGFTALEALMKTYGCEGRYCYGRSVSLADVYLVPQVWNAYRFNVDLTSFPLIEGVYSELIKHEAFKKSLPENQADAP